MNRSSAFCGTSVLLAVIALIVVIPQPAVAQTEKGIELCNSGEYQQAERILWDAFKADSKDTKAHYYLGLSLLEQKKNGEALDVFLKIKRSQDRADQRTRPPVPNEYQIQLAMGRARLALEQYDEAWKNIESARIENEKASSEVFMYRGVYYLQQEKYEEAVKNLEKAISLDVNNAYAYYYAGLTYYEMGNGKKAAEDLKTFLEMVPNAPEADKAREIRNLC